MSIGFIIVGDSIVDKIGIDIICSKGRIKRVVTLIIVANNHF